MAPAITPPYRADQVGSLLRPAWLSEARLQAKGGQLDAAALAVIEDRAIFEAVQQQEKIGLQTLSLIHI